MKEKKRDLLLNLLAGAVITGAVFALNMSRGYGFARSGCDGTFVAAVMLLGLGGIKGVRNKGAFDVVGYGLKTAVTTALPFLQGDRKEDLDQYRERKAAERKDSTGMLLAGAVYLVLAFLFLAIYHLV